jgi:hypothetical protein
LTCCQWTELGGLSSRSVTTRPNICLPPRPNSCYSAMILHHFGRQIGKSQNADEPRSADRSGAATAARATGHHARRAVPAGRRPGTAGVDMTAPRARPNAGVMVDPPSCAACRSSPLASPAWRRTPIRSASCSGRSAGAGDGLRPRSGPRSGPPARHGPTMHHVVATITLNDADSVGGVGWRGAIRSALHAGGRRFDPCTAHSPPLDHAETEWYASQACRECRGCASRACTGAWTAPVGQVLPHVDRRPYAIASLDRARRGQVVLDVNANEVEELTRKGTKQARRGGVRRVRTSRKSRRAQGRSKQSEHRQQRLSARLPEAPWGISKSPGVLRSGASGPRA